MQRIKTFLLSRWFGILSVIIGVALMIVFRDQKNSPALIGISTLGVYWLITFSLKKEYKHLALYSLLTAGLLGVALFVLPK